MTDTIVRGSRRIRRALGSLARRAGLLAARPVRPQDNRNLDVPKVFVIGFNKCGTTSLHRFFRENGVPAAHHRYHRNDKDVLGLARQMYRNRGDGRPLLDGMSRRIVYSDMEYNSKTEYLGGHYLFRELAEQYPNARFILNTRDKDAWLRSRLRHRNGVYAEKARQRLGTTADGPVIEDWARDWDAHHAAVRAFFADRPERLLEFNIERDDISALIAFLPYLQLDPRHWGRANATDEKPGQTL